MLIYVIFFRVELGGFVAVFLLSFFVRVDIKFGSGYFDYTPVDAIKLVHHAIVGGLLQQGSQKITVAIDYYQRLDVSVIVIDFDLVCVLEGLLYLSLRI